MTKCLERTVVPDITGKLVCDCFQVPLVKTKYILSAEFVGRGFGSTKVKIWALLVVPRLFDEVKSPEYLISFKVAV